MDSLNRILPLVSSWANWAQDPYPAFATHQSCSADQLNGVAQGCFQSNAGQDGESLITQLHILLLTPENTHQAEFVCQTMEAGKEFQSTMAVFVLEFGQNYNLLYFFQSLWSQCMVSLCCGLWQWIPCVESLGTACVNVQQDLSHLWDNAKTVSTLWCG